jgi:hypothetical protein
MSTTHFIFRFAGGRIAETWGVVDVFSQMRELGVIPTALATSELRPSSS